MLRFNIEKVDDLLGGGLDEGEILFIFGAPNSGKSLLAYQLACQYKSICVNTEVGSPDKFATFLMKRYGSNFKRPLTLHRRSLHSLMQTLGLRLKLVIKGRSDDESKSAKIESEIYELDEFPLLTLLKEKKSEILILDSLTAPIKGAMGVARQNFGARANIISRIMGQLSNIIDEVNIPIVVTAHESQDKANVYDEGRIWGGDSLVFYAKAILQMRSPNHMETPDKALYKKIRLRRRLGQLESKWVQLPLRKDYGFA